MLVNGKPLDQKNRPSSAAHIDDGHVLVTLGLISMLRLRSLQLKKFGFQPGDEVIFELEEETRSREELQTAAHEWRKAHGIPELTEDLIDELTSDAFGSKGEKPC